MNRESSKKMFNPIEWLSWLYGKLFTSHTILSYFLIPTIFSIVGLVIGLAMWATAIDKYHAEHSPMPAFASPVIPGAERPSVSSGETAITTKDKSPAIIGEGNSVNYNEPARTQKSNSKPPK